MENILVKYNVDNKWQILSRNQKNETSENVDNNRQILSRNQNTNHNKFEIKYIEKSIIISNNYREMTLEQPLNCSYLLHLLHQICWHPINSLMCILWQINNSQNVRKKFIPNITHTLRRPCFKNCEHWEKKWFYYRDFVWEHVPFNKYATSTWLAMIHSWHAWILTEH